MTGDVYPPNLELRLGPQDKGYALYGGANSANGMRVKRNVKNQPSQPQYNNATDYVDSGYEPNDDYQDSTTHDDHDTSYANGDAGLIGGNGGGIDGGGAGGGGGGTEDGFSSWDEESDDEFSSSPPDNVDVSKVELIGACPYCQISFVGPSGKILYSVLRRLTPGKEADFAENHIDRYAAITFSYP